MSFAPIGRKKNNMHSVKQINFGKEHPGSRFPWFQSLDATETQKIRSAIAEAFDVRAATTPLDLVTALDNKAEIVDECDAEAESFNLLKVFDRLGILPQPVIFINWYRFDQIDRMRVIDLSEDFRSIWYPSADDIDLFDSSWTWIISVSHFGALKSLLNLNYMKGSRPIA